MRAEWPLRGRDRELSHLVAALSTGGVVLAGPAGVGKTRLAREATALVRPDHAGVHWAAASRSAAAIPFGAFATLLPRDIGGGADRTALIVTLIETIRRPDGPRLVVVDDAHHLDEGSAALVHQLAVSGHATILLTVRDGAARPQVLDRLWLDEILVRIDVEPLTVTAVRDVLATALDGQVDPLSVDLLHQWCAGNVLFLRELVREGLDRGQLTQVSGVWRWTGRVRGGRRLPDAVAARLGQVPTTERAALLGVALAEPVDADAIAQVTSAGAVDAVVDRGLVRAESGGQGLTLRLTHPLYGEAATAIVPDTTARSLRRRLAEALAVRADGTPASVLRPVILRLDAGERLTDAEMLQGASAAVDLYDFVLAERLCRRFGSLPPEVVLVLARAVLGQGRAAEAERLLARVDLAAVPAEVAVQVALWRAYVLLSRCRAADPVAVLDRALAVVPAEHRRPLHDARAMALATEGRYREAVDAVGHSSTTRSIDQATALVVALAECGELTAAWEAARAGDVPLDSAPENLLYLLMNAGTVAYRRADPDALTGVCRRMHEWSRTARSSLIRGCAELLEGEEAIAHGAFGAAVTRLRGAIALLIDSGSAQTVGRARVQLALAAALHGDPATAQQALAEYAALDSARWPAYTRQFCGRWQAAALLALDQRHTAASLLRDLSAQAMSAQAWWAAMECLEALYRATGERVVATGLADCARRCDGPLAAAHLRFAEAAAAGDPAALAGAADGYAKIGHWPAAASAADRAALLAAGLEQHRLVTRCRAQLDGYLAHCEVTGTPSWLAATGRPRQVLTSREREIAYLAITNTNRNIADRLRLSVRTVENHLRQVYTKLGIAGRPDLPDALNRRP